MSRIVWKYPLPDHDDELSIKMPEGAELLAVSNQNNKPVMHALVDPCAPVEYRHFIVRGTGPSHPIDGENIKHVGTTVHYDGALVLHTFEVEK